MYKHKLNGATYESRKQVAGGTIFRVTGGDGRYQYLGAIVFLSNNDIAKFLEYAK